MTQDGLRVMIVDDHEVVREGLRALLNRRPGMSVVAEAGSASPRRSPSRSKMSRRWS